MIDQITLRKLKNRLSDGNFEDTYKKLLLSNAESISNTEQLQLLKAAIVLLNYGNNDSRKLGYSILLRYSILFHDYVPLYDFCINEGYIPVCKLLERNHLDQSKLEETLLGNLMQAYEDNFTDDTNSIYLSLGQKILTKFSQSEESSYALVAPTSYGKSEIIVNDVYSNLNSKLCILVPTKALLAQTKKRIVDHPLFGDSLNRIITHPDMFSGEEDKFVAVLTQERLLRLLQKNPSTFLGNLLIDEAHNLLVNDSRAKLLAQVILILEKRNPETRFKFFTPFISEPKNLKIPYANYELNSNKVDEFIKVEKYHFYDFTTDKKLMLYDQFIDDVVEISDTQYSNEKDFIKANKAQKNIVYFNRPKNIESFAVELLYTNDDNADSDILEAKEAISEYVHEDYRLLKCLDSGFVYHHGGMPEIVRLYVEDLFSKANSLEFILTSSTLLEGVNIPAQKLFLLSTKKGRRKLTPSQFKNLAGRVCRFSEIFDPQNGNIELLEPSIYLIKGGYEDSRRNLHDFLRETVKTDKKIKDQVENILLHDIDEDLDDEKISELNDSIEFLENIEPNTVSGFEIDYVESEIAKSCYKNNIYEFDIKLNENQLVQNLENYINDNPERLDASIDVIDAIYRIFIQNIASEDDNLKRLQNEPARRFYSMFLDWRTRGSSYKEMISSFLNYWNTLDSTVTYVGSRWGELKFEEDNFQNLYVDLSTKSRTQLINLAIVRTKEEQDLVDNIFIKFVEILNDLELVNPELRDKIKYGTADEKLISLLKNGVSLDLARELIKPEYQNYVSVNTDNDQVIIEHDVIEALDNAEVNKILVFEVKHHAK